MIVFVLTKPLLCNKHHLNPNQAGWWWLSLPPLVLDLPFQSQKRLWFFLWWLFKLKGITTLEKIILQVYYQKLWEIIKERHLVSLDFDKNKANFEINPLFPNQTHLLFIILNSTLCQPSIYASYRPKLEKFEFFILIIRKYIKEWDLAIWDNFDSFWKLYKGLVTLLQYYVGLDYINFQLRYHLSKNK